jgi:hypothetical protein
MRLWSGVKASPRRPVPNRADAAEARALAPAVEKSALPQSETCARAHTHMAGVAMVSDGPSEGRRDNVSA